MPRPKLLYTIKRLNRKRKKPKRKKYKMASSSDSAPVSPASSRPSSPVSERSEVKAVAEKPHISIFTCPVCSTDYNEADNQPKLLPCSHTFCLACLQTFAQDDASLKCPSCSARVTLSNGVIGINTNFYITEMMKYLQSLDGNYGNQLIKDPGCGRHANQPTSFFCRTCNIAVCRDCTVLDHDRSGDHAILDIGDVLAEYKEVIATRMVRASAAMLQKDSMIQMLSAEMGNMDITMRDAIRSADMAFDKYIRAFNDRRQELHNKINTIFLAKKAELEDSVLSMKSQMVHLHSARNVFEIAVSSGYFSDLLAVMSNSALNGKIDELMAPIDQDLGANYLQFLPEQGEEEFLQSLKSLGDVNSEKRLPSVVKIEPQKAIAGLQSSMTIAVTSSDGEELAEYPITVQIRDNYGDVIRSTITCIQNELNYYEVKYRPQISGIHHCVVQFMGCAIPDARESFMVLSNNPVMTFGKQGQGQGDLTYPTAVAIDDNQNIFITDVINNRIEKFDSTGNYLSEISVSPDSERESVTDIMLDGALIVTNKVMMSADKSNITPTSTTRIYSAEEGKPFRQFQHKDIANSYNLAINSHHSIIRCDYSNGRFYVFDQEGQILRKFGGKGAQNGFFRQPTFMCIGRGDDLVISDAGNRRVQILDQFGTFVREIGMDGSGKGQFKSPAGIAVDKNGYIIVVDKQLRLLQVFSYDGHYVCTIESSGDRLHTPMGIAVTNDGHVLVVDTGNHCVKKYKYC